MVGGNFVKKTILPLMGLAVTLALGGCVDGDVGNDASWRPRISAQAARSERRRRPIAGGATIERVDARLRGASGPVEDWVRSTKESVAAAQVRLAKSSARSDPPERHLHPTLPRSKQPQPTNATRSLPSRRALRNAHGPWRRRARRAQVATNAIAVGVGMLRTAADRARARREGRAARHQLRARTSARRSPTWAAVPCRLQAWTAPA